MDHIAARGGPHVGQPGRDAVQAFAEAGGDASEPEVQRIVALLGDHAPALLPLALGDTSVPADVLRRPLERADTEASLRAIFLEATEGEPDGPELRATLRQLRHRSLVRIALREVLRLADVDRTSAELAALASACTEAALRAAMRTETARHGEARDEQGRPIPLVVLGMGKLGGRELNLGSDIDLCFFYGTDDALVGGDWEITVHELYARVAQRATQALAEPTEDGFCFRVDLRLRPEGSRGALVNSLASAERYYETWGRTWERGALLRARPIAGDEAFGEELLSTLRPFVYRRQVDPGIAREMTEMLRRTRRELSVDSERDVKLGRGGIREAEFFVQTLQLVWGGRHPELQVRNTIDALHRLRAAGLVTHREAEDFEACWALLRRIEHRIHMRAGYQTHALPPRGPQLDAFARSLGMSDGAALSASLGETRDAVAALFGSLTDEDNGSESPALETLCDRVAAGATANELADDVAEALPVDDPVEAASHLVRLGRPATAPLGAVGREKTPELGPMLLREVAEAAVPDMALRFVADFFVRLGGVGGYDRMLVDHPRLLRRLVSLFGASATLSTALVGHPEAVDHLLTAGGAPSPEAIAGAHAEPPLAFEGSPPDPEDFVAALRGAKREITLEVGLAHVGGELDLQGVEVLLTALAEQQVAAALRYARAETFERLGTPTRAGSDEGTEASPPDMVVVGMGKLGARELGFAGDLDLMFLYGADGETQTPSGRSATYAEIFTRVGQRTMRLLSQPDAEGPGYETDTRLRPSGSQGMLVVSLGSFDRYHANRAEPWERQALIRARPVAGDTELSRMASERFERLAFEGQAPPPDVLAQMRRRIQAELAGERADRYHPKLGHGGLVDVEFVVQWLQMRHGESAGEPDVRRPRTLDALSALRERGHVEPADAEALEEGYLFFRNVEQAMKLLDETREPILLRGGRGAEQLARRLGIRDRDGESPTHVLELTWRRHAEEIRTIFERIVAPVEIAPPWQSDEEASTP